MSETTTLAEVFMSFGGKTLYTTGTAFTSIGVIYGINKITSLGIGAIDLLPYWLGMKELTESEKKEAIFTKESLGNEIKTYFKIGSVITAGVLIKIAGGKLSETSLIEAANKLLYRK